MGKPKRPHIQFYSSRLEIGLPEVDSIIQAQSQSQSQSRHGFDCGNRIIISIIKHDEIDRISKLPDDTLQYVISLLTMREAAATCVLSTRWRSLWVASASRLDFTDSNLFGRQYPEDLFQFEEEDDDDLHNNRRRRRPHCRMMLSANRLLQPRKHKRPGGVLRNERTKFIKRVNHILKLRHASAMDEFTLTFPMGHESATHLDKWMKLAAAQGVTNLDLNFNWLHFYLLGFKHSDRYEFPLQRFGSSLNYLRLTCCAFDFPPHFRGLSSLVSLTLRHSILTSDNVQNILSNCLSLQWLSLNTCYFPRSTILKLTSPATPLKHLDISSPDNVEEIKLHNLNQIVSFELYATKFEKLSIRDVPRLSRLVLRTWGAVEISGAVPHLDTLFLNHRVDGNLPSSSAFNNLKRLVFSAGPNLSNLFEVVSLLDACPLLQQLELDMGYFHRRCTKPSAAHVTTVPGFLHSTLTQVEIRAFESHPDQIELAKYLLKTAIALKMMKIYTTCKKYIGNGLWTFSENGRLEGTALKEVYTLLRKEARPSTKLLIRST